MRSQKPDSSRVEFPLNLTHFGQGREDNVTKETEAWPPMRMKTQGLCL